MLSKTITLRRILRLGALAALAWSAAASQGHAGGGVAITQCGETATRNAFLARDLYCPGSNGIVVGGSGITIDLKGHVLRGDHTADRYGVIDVGYGRLTVKNGIVRNFDYGVYGDNADGITVSSVLAAGNAAGVVLLSDSATVRSSAAGGNSGTGIYVEGGSGSVTSSTASGNGGAGIFVLGQLPTVRTSAAAGNGRVGIYVEGASPTVRSSSATGNGGVGIGVSGDAATIKGNRAEGNGFEAGASDLDGLGIHASDYTTAPAGTSVARGNDDPDECDPAPLC